MDLYKYCKENKLLNQVVKITSCIKTSNGLTNTKLVGKQGNLMIVGQKFMVVGVVTTEMVYNIIKDDGKFIVMCKDALYTLVVVK